MEYSPRDLNGIFIDFPSYAVATAFVLFKKNVKKNKKYRGVYCEEKNPLFPSPFTYTLRGTQFFLNEPYISSYVSYSN